jgi:hypothetical protein
MEITIVMSLHYQTINQSINQLEFNDPGLYLTMSFFMHLSRQVPPLQIMGSSQRQPTNQPICQSINQSISQSLDIRNISISSDRRLNIEVSK